MKTYNFEQAMEGVFHGLKVRRLGWVAEWPEYYIRNERDSVYIPEHYHIYCLTINDFYAQDWVAYEGE